MSEEIDDMLDEGLDLETSAQEAPTEEPKQEAAPEPPKENPREVALRRLIEAYALKDENFDPKAHLPSLAARLHLDVYEAAMGAIMHQLPVLLQQMAIAQRAEEEFFSEFPMLRDPKYRQSIIEAAKAVKASGEKLTPEQARERVGRMVLAMHGLTPSRPVRPPVPAAPGASAHRAAPKQPENIWAELLEE